NLENWFIVLRQGKTPDEKYETIDQAQKDGAVTENVGRFLQQTLNFLLVAITLFVIVYTATKPEPAPASGATQTCHWCSANVPLKAVKCMYCTSYLN
ncbi:hypothetical protein EDD21DRAFT_284376, partial [Dissophora ornata]